MTPAPYTPATLASDLAASIGQILPYVGVAVGAVLVVVFALIGIRKGVNWARSLVYDRREARGDYDF